MTAAAHPLRLAILGTSGIAAAHLAAFRRTGRAEIAAVYSRDPGRAEEFAKRHAVGHFTDSLDGLLSDTALDAAIIATEPARHAGLALACLKAGKPVLIEKPLDADLAVASELAAHARSCGIPAAIVSQRRFEPAAIAMKKELAGAGQPISAQLSMHWRRDFDYYQAGSGWRGQDGGAVFLNQGIHWLDLLIWLFGRPACVAVEARATREFLSCPDEARAVIEFESGVQVTCDATTNASVRQGDRFSIVCQAGSLDYQDYLSRNELRPSLFRRLIGQRSRGVDLLRLQAEDFLQAVQGLHPPAANLDDGLLALRLALALSPPLKENGTAAYSGSIDPVL